MDQIWYNRFLEFQCKGPVLEGEKFGDTRRGELLLEFSVSCLHLDVLDWKYYYSSF